MSYLKNILPGYKCKFVPPKSSKCGGVAVFYKNNYKVEIRTDFLINSEYPCSDIEDVIDVDELWIDSETNNGFKSTIGIIYRHPKANLTKFNDRLYNVLGKIS